MVASHSNIPNSEPLAKALPLKSPITSATGLGSLFACGLGGHKFQFCCWLRQTASFHIQAWPFPSYPFLEDWHIPFNAPDALLGSLGFGGRTGFGGKASTAASIISGSPILFHGGTVIIIICIWWVWAYMGQFLWEMLMSKWWGGDTVGEDDVGSHVIIALLKLSLCHFLWSSEVGAERRKK
jgi:hypothetical protein